ncbi:MAG: hypothetical protein A2V67_20730 [Deltaproteobacteria bacterium RBG_13_61_14]|nr:MAG: hypothetical protein A2V67_20730 [Deltaproteobacteria bacterium RBG_13_61_14]
MSYSYRRVSFGPGLTPAVMTLLIINVGAFALRLFLPNVTLEAFALIPAQVFPGLQLWRVVTYLFLHADFAHIFFNMLGLFFFGPPLEQTWGTRRFYIFYFLTGVGAGVVAVPFYILFGGPLGPMTPIIGASGAIFGLLAGFALLYPNQVIYLQFLFPIKAKWLVLIYGAMEFFSTVSYAGGRGTGVANAAHLAGLVIAYFYVRRFSDFQSIPFRLRQWRRRRQFKSLQREQNRRDDNGPTFH